MDEETRLNRELMKLEKEQERKKKELQARWKRRKKEQHAKRASRHISICFVIFFPACFLFSNCLFFAFLLSVKAFPFSLSPRSSKRTCAASRTSRWKWIRWSPAWQTNLEKLIEKKKEYDDVLKSMEDPRPDFFLFFGFFQHFSQTWILDSPSLIKVLTKLWLYQSKFHQNFD